MLIRPRALRTAAWCTSLVLTGGCAVDPPPAPQSTQASQSLAPAPKASQIIMAIDSIGAGFNPHLLSDQSPVNAAVSALVFPSSFRPVPDPASPTGSRWVMDPNLLVSATVTSNKPFTVTYRIRPEAAWTDNAPIAADDFWYLWRQMVSQPGVVDPAGYDLITGVQSVDGGKTAVVTFAQPYPAWRELFNDLVPAHIVKDAPGGFAAGLSRVLPVTGGQFRVDNIDPQRDEILLARNDRFWGAPAKPDQILFRRGGAPAALADSIRNGDTQVAQVHGGSAAFAQLATIPDVRTGRILTPRVMQLTLRGRQPKLSDPVLRKAILGLLDVDLLATVGAGSDNSVTLDQALVRAPSDPGYQATAPASLGRERALQLFAEAGYRVDRSPTELRVPPVPDADDGAHPPGSTRDRISRNGQTLALVIGAAANDPTSVAVANTAADQLRGAGLAATVLALDPATLYGPALEQNRVDAIVGWRSAGGDLATLLASRYSCPALDAVPIATTGARPPVPAPPPAAQPGATTTPVSTTSVSTTPVSTTPVSTTPVSTTPVSTTPVSTTSVSTTSVSNTPATTTSEPSPGPAPLVRAPSNLGGVCDRDIQPKIDGALSGALNIDDVIAAVEPRLWALATELPIMQDSTIVAIGPGVANVSLNGAIPVGIVGDAGRWVKTSP